MDKIYLIAQPNSGKTTLFNQLACENCYVANWPGKTVETFKAKIEHHGKEIELVDLPGINSFKTLSKEEELTKEVIFGNEGVAIVLVNGESLYRSLYFAVQVLELRENAIVAINKLDYLEKKGIHINAEIMSKKLGVEVIVLSALRGIGINQLLDRSIDYLEGRLRGKRLRIGYGSLEIFIERLEKITGDRALAIRAIEGDEFVLSSLPTEKRAEVERVVAEISGIYGNPEEIIAVHRHRFVEEVINSAVKEVRLAREHFGEKLDRVFFSKLGTPFSVTILFFALFVSFSINTGFPLNLILRSAGYVDLAEIVENYSLVGLISAFFDWISLFLDFLPESVLKSLMVDGIIPGIGAVASFFPLILILNYIMSLIEDSGIMARIAVATDRFFATFSLTGKSIFPFSINLACNVPGVATTRILETDSERIRVALASPFVLCQARLLVILLFVAALLPSPLLQSTTLVSVYVLSALLFVVATGAYRKVVKKESSELLIELPPYHFPSLKVSWWITWARSKAFIIKVGRLLLMFSVLMWFFDYLGFTNLIGRAIAILFTPFGLESPEFGFAILMGFLAKELIISALAISFGTPNPSEILLHLALTPAQAIALIIFIAFYTPCVATLSALYNEIRSYRLLLISVAFQLLVAYSLALLSYLLLSFLKI